VLTQRGPLVRFRLARPYPFLAIRAGIAGRDMDHWRAFIDKRQFIVATSAVVETDNGILDQFAQQSAWAEIRRGLADDRGHGS
jgi:hypothetical protein